MRTVAVLAASLIVLAGVLIGIMQSPKSPTGAAVYEDAIVTKIIDGDTIVVEGGQKVRLLGIDTDEKGSPCFYPAKERISDLILNRQVKLQGEGDNKDMYDRLLRWVWLDGKNINEQMVAEGLAVARFEQRSAFQDEVAVLEHTALVNNIGCKWENFTIFK